MLSSAFGFRSFARADAHRAAALSSICMLLTSVACGLGEEPAMNDPKWLSRAMERSVGEPFVVPYDDEDAQHVMHGLGYAKLSAGHYERRVDLTAQQTLVPSAMPSLPGIDAIAMITIRRPTLGDKQYVYDSLRSLFAELPQEAQINLLVGNNDATYLSEDILMRELGAALCQRVHIHAAPDVIAEFFVGENIGVVARSTWNYARALRSYRGQTHLLLVEDDISLATGSLMQLRPYLDAPRVPVMTLFNDRCASVATTWTVPGSQLSLGASTQRRSRDFPTTQAVLFSSAVANDAGRYLMTRAGRMTYDYMLGQFFAQDFSVLGYVQPSIVQHEGRTSAGLSVPGHEPLSTCYLGDKTSAAIRHQTR